MNRVVLAFLALEIGSGFLIAGPEPIRDDKKAVVMPQEHQEPCTWAGFYVGGNIGGAFDTADLRLELDGLWNTSLPHTRDVGEELGSRDLDANGLIAGGFLGYNYQWRRWVFGLEANIDYLGLRDSFNSGYQTVAGDGGNVINLRQSFETHYVATFAPRIGYTWNRLMFYGTGGLAFGDVRFSQRLNETDSGIRQEGSSDDTEVGWMVGTGAEYCLTQHWHVRLEYRYIDLEGADFSTTGTLRSPGRQQDLSGFSGHHEADVTFHSVTAGFVYQF
ncbi:MAG: outer membrane beta-barrel protein [Verrucomicrobiota bacterium]